MLNVDHMLSILSYLLHPTKTSSASWFPSTIDNAIFRSRRPSWPCVTIPNVGFDTDGQRCIALTQARVSRFMHLTYLSSAQSQAPFLTDIQWTDTLYKRSNPIHVPVPSFRLTVLPVKIRDLSLTLSFSVPPERNAYSFPSWSDWPCRSLTFLLSCRYTESVWSEGRCH